jgi:hypothetical protein
MLEIHIKICHNRICSHYFQFNIHNCNFIQSIVASLLIDIIVKTAEKTFAEERLCKHARQWFSKRQVIAEMLKYATIEELLEAVFSVGSAPSLCGSVPQGQRLSATINLTCHKALIRSVMNYACLAWEFPAYTHLLKLQRLLNKVLRTIGNCPRCTQVRDLHTAFNLPYVCDYIKKLYRQQAEVIPDHHNDHDRSIGKGEDRPRKYKRLKFGAVKLMTYQVTKVPL